MPDQCCCNGEGWYWNEERQRRVICRCPAGWAKKKYLEGSREDHREEAKRRKGKKRKEPVPF